MDSLPEVSVTSKSGDRQQLSNHCALQSDSLRDAREQLYNDGKIGPITQVQLSEAEITSLHGLMLDLDLRLFRREVVPDCINDDAEAFYRLIVSKWLSHHPVLGKAEVRSSGNGLHVILRFDQPLQFQTEGDRQRWSAIVRVIQRLLPTDPDCPGITALTRPIGSINGKSGREVKRLHEGELITIEEITGLFDQVRAAPFRTVATILFGRDHITPCPICGREQSRLDVLDRIGKCYGHCGQVRLGQLFNAFLQPRPTQES